MTDSANETKLAEYINDDPPKSHFVARMGHTVSRICKAVLEAMHESRRMQAEREIARFLARQQSSGSNNHIDDWPSVQSSDPRQPANAEQAAIAELRSLSDRDLKDIGLHRSEVLSAIRNPPTRRSLL
jgi:hypothetical protein